MRKVIKALPGIKTIIRAVAVCLTLGLLTAGGFRLEALWGLALAVSFIAVVTLRNYDPDSYEAWHEPRAYSYRQQRDLLLRRLQALTVAVEAANLQSDHPAALAAVEARAVLDQIVADAR